MHYTTILYTQRDHIAYITLNQPDVGNIINQQLARELVDICCGITQDDSIYVVIITGAGNQAFCLGSELERLVAAGNTIESSALKLKERSVKQYDVSAAIAAIDRPVIAAINGDALGQGLELALSCDIRLAANRARLGFPEVASGLMPMDGGSQRLPRLVGRGKALELILSAETISAKEASEIGLVSQVVPQASLIAEAEKMAQSLAHKAPLALRFIKEAVNKGPDLTLEQGLRLEADLYFLLQTTADRTEGIKAFLEKRAAQFKGQ